MYCNPRPETFDVSKLDKFKAVNFSHALNIDNIDVTFDVFQLDTSSVVKTLQLSNILDIVVTFDVFQLETSNDCNLPHI